MLGFSTNTSLGILLNTHHQIFERLGGPDTTTFLSFNGLMTQIIPALNFPISRESIYIQLFQSKL